MKIIYAGPFDTNGIYKGGITTVVNDIYNEYLELKKRGLINIEIIKCETCQVKRAKKNQGKLNITNIVNSFFILIAIIKILHKGNIDYLYYNSSAGVPLLKDLLLLFIVKKIYSIKTIIHIHFAESNKILLHNTLLKRMTLYLLKINDIVVFLSKNTRDEFINFGIKKEKTKLLYNFHHYDFSIDEIEDKLYNISSNKTLQIIFIGSIDKRKGILCLLDAISRLRMKYILHICGQITDESIIDAYHNKIRDINTEQIIEHGYVSGDEKKKILKTGHLLVLPSFGEGFPIVLLEGISAGCALITTDVGASKEVFTSDNCLFSPIGDVDGLRKCIEFFDINREYLINTCLNNYKLSKKYTLNNFMNEWLEIFKVN